jgi:HlyD family secretion protein
VDELQRKLRQADVISSRNGVVTWVQDQIGANVMPGEIVAKIADLGSYKLEANISNIYADQIHVGQEAILRINEIEIRGNIINIDPSVRNGLITFSVVLHENNHPILRPQIKVEVFVVTDSKQGVIKVPNGPAFSGATNQVLFVAEDDKAYRRNVTTGLNNFDFVEIIEGILEGDNVIISDMKRYDKRERLRLK